MINITLKPEEWSTIVNILAQAPFNVVHTLIAQIQQQASQPQSQTPPQYGIDLPMRGDHLNGSADPRQ